MVSGEARAAGEGVRGVGIARKIARRFLVGSREAEMGGDGSRWCKWGAWVMNTPLEGPAPADSSFFRLRSWFILKERTQVADSDPIGKHDSWRDHGFGTGFLGQISSMGLGYDDLSSRGADSARETGGLRRDDGEEGDSTEITGVSINCRAAAAAVSLNQASAVVAARRGTASGAALEKCGKKNLRRGNVAVPHFSAVMARQ
ncbi:hypothetical protein FB45DRAFT_874914 [Roridomyces roridus]|uniref:Uncharacterized protein n=1 Tax=Roridomyces roridus TaxID=1738132 RepID=A0AAD7B870_9AGAR|nr:hypothetical protein FB45DRAFT_874914 [Roridomyces roridus]